MAYYEATVISPLSVEEAWRRLSDVARFVEWDPGVVAAKQVAGENPGPDTSYLLTVKGIGGNLDMQYDVVSYEDQRRYLMIADTKMLRSEDEIEISASGDGSRVRYGARLTTKGVAGIVNPVLGLFFDRIGDRAADGLRTFLEAA